MTTLARLLFCAIAALLFGCTTPSREDVEADRARHTFLSLALADNVLDGTESPLWHGAPATATTAAVEGLRLAWDRALLAMEARVAAASSPLDGLIAAYGVAGLNVLLKPKIKPEVWALLDADRDGSLSVAELRALDPTSPAFATALMQVLVEHLAKR